MMSVAVKRPQEAVRVPYTLRMSMAEGTLVNTLMVMFRTSAHDQMWAVASNMLAGMGLNQPQAEVVYRNALEIAKRRLRA